MDSSTAQKPPPKVHHFRKVKPDRFRRIALENARKNHIGNAPCKKKEDPPLVLYQVPPTTLATPLLTQLNLAGSYMLFIPLHRMPNTYPVYLSDPPCPIEEDKEEQADVYEELVEYPSLYGFED